ncbi:MAG: LytS/YhcK type 5TM receptor domain-containing protein [Melioribacteraceae bacterium]
MVIDLIYNLAVLVALSVLSGFVDSRFDRKQKIGKVLQGILFGSVAIVGMLYPFNFSEGIIFDGRSIVISLNTLFFGPLSGAISSIMALAYRNYLGGSGALMGTLVIISSYLIGIYFFNSRSKKDSNNFLISKRSLTNLNLYLFGVIVSAIMVLCMFSLPSKSIFNTFQTIALTVMTAYPLITLIIGKVLLDQEDGKIALKRIKEEVSLFRTTLYSIGDAVITTDAQGKIQHMNSVAEKLTGWLESSCKGLNLDEVFKIINETTLQKVESPVDKVLSEGKIVSLANHTMLISKEGEKIPIADSGSPIVDADGKLLGVVLVFRDQTAERVNTRKVTESESRLKLAELISQTGNWELHLKSKKIVASDGALKIYGIKTHEIDYEIIKEIPLKEYRSLLDSAMNNLILHGIPYNVEFKIKTEDTGEIKHIKSQAQYDKEKGLVFGVIHDISELKLNEERLKESLVTLERSNKHMVGRELTMIDLKKEVNSLLTKMSLPSKYNITE